MTLTDPLEGRAQDGSRFADGKLHAAYLIAASGMSRICLSVPAGHGPGVLGCQLPQQGRRVHRGRPVHGRGAGGDGFGRGAQQLHLSAGQLVWLPVVRGQCFTAPSCIRTSSLGRPSSWACCARWQRAAPTSRCTSAGLRRGQPPRLLPAALRRRWDWTAARCRRWWRLHLRRSALPS